MQESIQTWAGESAWRFENLIYNVISQFKAIGMRRLSEKQNRKKFIKLLSLPISQSRFPGEHNWCYDWNRNCSGEDEKGEGWPLTSVLCVKGRICSFLARICLISFYSKRRKGQSWTQQAWQASWQVQRKMCFNIFVSVIKVPWILQVLLRMHLATLSPNMGLSSWPGAFKYFHLKAKTFVIPGL